METVKFYCINLARRPDRWKNCLEEANRNGFSIERVEAIDAQDESVHPDLNKMPSKGPVGNMSLSTRACTKSHMKAWETFLESGDQFAVFLEDDFIASKSTKDIIISLSKMSKPLDVVKLCTLPERKKKKILAKREVNVPEIGRSIYKVESLFVGAFGYALSRRAAQRAHGLAESSSLPVDHFLFNPQRGKRTLGLTIHLVEPCIITLDEAASSDIGNNRTTGSRFLMHIRRGFYELGSFRAALPGIISGSTRVIEPRFI